MFCVVLVSCHYNYGWKILACHCDDFFDADEVSNQTVFSSSGEVFFRHGGEFWIARGVLRSVFVPWDIKPNILFFVCNCGYFFVTGANLSAKRCVEGKIDATMAKRQWFSRICGSEFCQQIECRASLALVGYNKATIKRHESGGVEVFLVGKSTDFGCVYW